MVTGYALPDPGSCRSYDSFRDEFRWDLPDRYNISSACLEPDESSRREIALHHVTETGASHGFTFCQLDRASNRLAGYFAERGISRESHVGLCFPQSPELLISHLAVYKLGGVTVPISVLLGRESMSLTLEHSECDHLVIDSEVYRRFGPESGCFDPVDQLLRVDLDPGKYTESDHFLGGYAVVVDHDGEVDVAHTAADDPALLLYTSGTSGKPKGVLLPHRYLIGCLPGNQLWYDLLDPVEYAAQRIWAPSEWAWAGALFNVVFPTLAFGGTVVSKERRSGFDPRETLSFIDEFGITRAFMPPTALSLIREEIPRPDTNLPSLAVVQSGGEALNPGVQKWAECNLDLIVNEGYGQTEANALVGNCRALFEQRVGSMGRPLPGHDLFVLDEHDQAVEDGIVGELAIAEPDPVLFLKYWKDPIATDDTFTADGAMRTGDMVEIDEEGYVWFRGRKDDLIISSGYRVSPVEVEDSLERHPMVQEAIVGGVGSEDRTYIKAFVRMNGPGDESNDSTFTALRSHVRERLGAHKTPDEFEVLRDPPQTRTGKIDRSVLFRDD